jgi:hypothetical protein
MTKSISTGGEYVTPNNKIYWEKAGLAQEIGFSAPN